MLVKNILVLSERILVHIDQQENQYITPVHNVVLKYVRVSCVKLIILTETSCVFLKDCEGNKHLMKFSGITPRTGKVSVFDVDNKVRQNR
jgi:hypothetical protein